MPNPLVGSRTGTPDVASGLKLATVSAREDASIQIASGIPLTDHLPNGPTAHRATVTTADSATDMSSVGFGTGTLPLNNRASLMLWTTFSAADGMCTLRPIYYDDAATPVPMALGNTIVFQATTRRLSASGRYMSQAQGVVVPGFARVKIFVEALSTGNLDIFAEPL